MSSNNDSYRQQQTQYQQQQYDWLRQQAGQQPQPWNGAAYPPQNPNIPSPQNRNANSSQTLNPSSSPSSTAFNTTSSSYQTKVNLNEPDNELNDRRRINRTPSPTPSELRELNSSGAIDWKTILKWRFWIRREWAWYYVILVIILTITALITIYHTQIVHWLTPVTKWLHDLKFGWLVPIGILFVISFPPLFGHEIVAVLCGLVWGLWIGFGIVAAGTFIGEVGNFYAFKYCCRARGEKMEKNKITYACLAKVVREGGFKIALIARLSAIPGHFTTAIFSTCGMGILVFSLAAILSMPKQFITVYLGVILEQSGDGSKPDTKSRVISDVVLVITFLVTIAAMWYILREMGKVKPQVIYERRKARQVKLDRPFSYAHDDVSGSSMSFNPNASDTNIPLHRRPTSQQYPFGRDYQIGSGSPNLVFAPRPQHTNQYGYVKDDDLASDESSSTGHGVQQHRGYTHARQNTEEVGWETGAPHDYIPPRRTMSPEGYNPPTQRPNMQQNAAHMNFQQYPSPPQQYNPQNRMSPVQTPTQTQYAINFQPPTASTVVPSSPSPLPTPKYHTTFAEQVPPVAGSAAPSSQYTPSPQTAPIPQHQQSYHMAEPTGMSYHTAMGSEDGEDLRRREASEVSVSGYIPGGFNPQPQSQQRPGRVYSPPPPSYRTDAR